jgi:hypothetical protein
MQIERIYSSQMRPCLHRATRSWQVSSMVLLHTESYLYFWQQTTELSGRSEICLPQGQMSLFSTLLTVRHKFFFPSLASLSSLREVGIWNDVYAGNNQNLQRVVQHSGALSLALRLLFANLSALPL